MDKNRIEGAMHEAKGAVLETAGKITGDRKRELLGAIENRFGKAQRQVGQEIDQERRKKKRSGKS